MILASRLFTLPVFGLVRVRSVGSRPRSILLLGVFVRNMASMNTTQVSSYESTTNVKFLKFSDLEAILEGF